MCFEARTTEEWKLFAETITNNETYFFRERAHFLQLAELVPSLGDGHKRPIRALSAGCSSGEEAYGMAMVLASRLGAHRAFEVHGVDLSEAKLEEARAGRYAERSFHHDELPPPGVLLGDYMTRDPSGTHHVRASLRGHVSFTRANLTDPKAIAPLGTFDVVFCRNLLIYADEIALPRFHTSLASLVRVGGLLFLGHSDSLGSLGPPFRLQRVGDRYAYVRT